MEEPHKRQQSPDQWAVANPQTYAPTVHTPLLVLPKALQSCLVGSEKEPFLLAGSKENFNSLFHSR